MTNRLDGKTCIVTGAGRGIGLAIVKAFADNGARLVVNDLDTDAADAAVGEITAAGGEAVANYEPIGSLDAANSVVGSALDSFGRLDVLVNNAGVLRDKMTHTMTEEDFDLVVQVHLKGTWACGRAAIQHWRPLAKNEAASGTPAHRKIINVTSASGLIGAVGQGNYAAAKMGIVGLTKTWAKELGRLNINVNADRAGRVDGDDGTIDAGSRDRESASGALCPWSLRDSRGDCSQLRVLRVAGVRLHHRPGSVRGRRPRHLTSDCATSRRARRSPGSRLSRRARRPSRCRRVLNPATCIRRD